jgi:hypothetical protein
MIQGLNALAVLQQILKMTPSSESGSVATLRMRAPVHVDRSSPKWYLEYDQTACCETIVMSEVRSQVLTAVKMLVFVFWVVTPFGLLGAYQRFGGTRFSP